MMRISNIWRELENEKSVTSGLLFRRYAATVLPDIFVAVKQPEKVRCIAFKVSNNTRLDVSGNSQLKDIRLEIVPDESKGIGSILLILLANRQLEDIFSVVCEDLINAVSELTKEEKVVRELLNRLEKWKSLFDKASLQGLTPSEQCGFFGELYFLRRSILKTQNPQACVTSWIGPAREVRDFQYGDWGVEVKTTSGNNHQKVHISSERQLDTANLDRLYLFHLSVEVQQAHGETLNQLVDEITELLSSDITTQVRFRAKLLEGGYFSHQRQIYDHTGYQVRQSAYYQVKDNFPRIEERDIRQGVGDVKYSIILTECGEYVINEEQVFETMNFYGNNL